MLSPAELLSEWDKAAKPDHLGLHNGAGFAMKNWELIREMLKASRTQQGEMWGLTDDELSIALLNLRRGATSSSRMPEGKLLVDAVVLDELWRALAMRRNRTGQEVKKTEVHGG